MIFKNNKILTIKELAYKLRVTPQTIKKRIKEGKLKKTNRVGRRILLKGEDVNKFIKKLTESYKDGDIATN